MENKEIDPILELTKVMRNFEQRLIKNEQLVLHTFSYLYNRCDENQLDYSYIQKDIENLYAYYTVLNNEFGNIKLQIPDKLLYINTNNSPSKIRRKKPWHYFISKYFRYRTLLKEKAQLEEQIKLKLEEERRLKEEKEKQIREEQEKQRIEMQKRIDEQRKKDEQLKQERRRKAKNEMNKILSGLK